MKYVIEHLEPKLGRWCTLEYEWISELVGPSNLIFTNVKPQTVPLLDKLGAVHKEKAAELLKGKILVLDQDAQKTLTTADTKEFDYLVFGGILGDDPPTGKTKEITRDDWERRTLGNKQMPTDTAIHVVKLISEGKELEQLKFIDDPEIEIKEGESVILPFRYLDKDGKPLMSEELLHYIKTKKGF